uniref:Uncharacterized protein n=1 Tax=Anguilla anguilla TaxID=7936 RepID=A0A0E9WC66_ANGAN
MIYFLICQYRMNQNQHSLVCNLCSLSIVPKGPVDGYWYLEVWFLFSH